MARGRLILRSLGSSRKFADTRTRAGALGEFAQSLYPLLVACSDDYGRQAGDAFTVKHAVFPTSPRTEVEFDETLDVLHEAGLVVRYEVGGRQVLQIVEFEKGQPNLHKRTGSQFPEPSGYFPEFPSELKRTEPNSTQQNRTAHGAEAFEAFWSAYPKKKSKADAEKAWRKLAPSPELCQRIHASIAAQLGSEDWRKDAGKYIPYPASWLNGRRWEDEAPAPAAVSPSVDDDWFEECQALHGGNCGGSMKHRTRMLLDRAKGA